jgi:hypothetical protein
MNKLHKALVMTAAIAVQGLAVPTTPLAADLFSGQTLLPKSASTAECQRRGGGGGSGARPSGGAAARPAGGGAARSSGASAQRAQAGGAAGSRNVRTNASSNVNRGANVNSNRNVNRNTNVNANRNVNVNVNGNYGGGYGYNDGWDHHPVAAGLAIGAGAAIVGSIVNSVPPSCSTMVVNGISYSQCGSTWYAPQYSGTNVQYVVVDAPR